MSNLYITSHSINSQHKTSAMYCELNYEYSIPSYFNVLIVTIFAMPYAKFIRIKLH